MRADVTSLLNRVEEPLTDVLVTLVNVIVLTEPRAKPSLASQIIVFVGSIYQAPTANYTITGAGYDITFTSAPPDGEPINIIRNLVAPSTP